MNNIKLKSEVCECACQYFRKPFSPFRQHYYSFCLNDPSDPFFPIRSISPHPTPFPLPRSLPLHPRCFPIPPRALRRVVGILGNYPSLPPSSADPFCLSPFFIIHPLLPSSPPSSSPPVPFGFDTLPTGETATRDGGKKKGGGGQRKERLHRKKRGSKQRQTLSSGGAFANLRQPRLWPSLTVVCLP